MKELVNLLKLNRKKIQHPCTSDRWYSVVFVTHTKHSTNDQSCWGSEEDFLYFSSVGNVAMGYEYEMKSWNLINQIGCEKLPWFLIIQEEGAMDNQTLRNKINKPLLSTGSRKLVYSFLCNASGKEGSNKKVTLL